MSIESLTPASREEWLAIRRGAIGASEVAAILGLHDYMTPLELWGRKTGRLPDLETTPAMRRGHRLEAVALDILAEERPDWTITPNPIPGGKVFIDRAARQSCTPDAFAIDPERPGRGIAQVKSVHPSAFRKWQDELPLRIALQVTQEAALTGADWAVVVALVIDQGADIHILDVPVDLPELVARIRAEVATFWQHVETGTPPLATPGRDLDTLKALALGAPKPAEAELRLDGDNALLDALASYSAAQADIAALRGDTKIAEARKDAAEEVIREKIGAYALATAGEYAIMQKRSERKGYTVKPSSSLRLTVSHRSAAREAA